MEKQWLQGDCQKAVCSQRIGPVIFSKLLTKFAKKQKKWGTKLVQSTQNIYSPPKHIVSAATIILNDQEEILLFCGIYQNVNSSICNTLFFF